MSNKMAVDLQNAHGAEESVTIKNRFDTLMKTYGYHPAATDIDASLRAAIAATAILEVYLVRAEEAEVVELEAAAAPVMSLDWPPRGGTRDRHARQRQWEVSRRGSETYSRDEMSEELYDGPSGLAADWQRPADYTRYADGDAAPRRAMPAGGGASGSPVDVGALAKGTKVRVSVVGPTPLGYNVVVNDQTEGLVYHSDIFDEEPLAPGAALDGWVVKVREDGKVDVSLRQPAVQKRIADGAQAVLQAIIQAGDEALAIGDKSSPDEIADALGMSKKNFKDAIGLLYRRRLVEVEEESIRLTPEIDWTAEGRSLLSSAKAGKATKREEEDEASSGGGWGNFSPGSDWDEEEE